ncbi:hypothetical protein ACWIUD_10300 [Helicobacter sp. 23-1044]
MPRSRTSATSCNDYFRARFCEKYHRFCEISPFMRDSAIFARIKRRIYKHSGAISVEM